MAKLCLVSVLWAFSFSLIGVYLAGEVDAYLSVSIRLGLALVCFLPLLSWRRTSAKLATQLMGIGAVQLGVMYSFYFHGFLYLSVAEVLLFTIMTPVYIAVLEDLLHKTLSPRYLVAALLSVAGAAVLNYREVTAGFWTGFALMQGANLSFAIGQVTYRHVMKRTAHVLDDKQVFGYFFLGAFLFSALMTLFLADLSKLPSESTQWGVLLWLGVLASGAGTYLWNRGAREVNAGTLAVMNNLVIPLGILVNLTIWQRDTDMSRLAAGSSIILIELVIAYFPQITNIKRVASGAK